jgi:hypothetical protein
MITFVRKVFVRNVVVKNVFVRNVFVPKSFRPKHFCPKCFRPKRSFMKLIPEHSDPAGGLGEHGEVDDDGRRGGFRSGGTDPQVAG